VKLSRRIFLITLAISIAAVTGLTIVTSLWMRDALREASLRRIADSVNREAQVLQRSLDLLKTDALFLAELDLSRLSATDGAAPDPVVRQARAALGKTLAAMMSRRPAYTQLRLISAREDGAELVRVNATDDGPVVVAEGELQRKGERYYVDESLKIAPGRLYVSPVDLNQEHDRIV
jgi:methyl-accepting chemotaxis protein